ncbi:flagellar basal-body MS-ring/collar protein FliF [Oceanidesulfovibrio marinus]|uniref:Flagellar M-ring protein n=1 Tax=Oceanidesulfovibrio marinus TaxID=370038 RepID=A0A6P1ZE88_9BACT|nr:flagellar basal-body MS-ring/collar protein FliF [Oceanidesulfovibrio marinus]QJT10491.1 flagellar M-ring protein FliF [Oceanidesulfovibrio marinus]TVM30187.1 flagellar M-ring protein FliF [Oceanidesulfovibrio marinus]
MANLLQSGLDRAKLFWGSTNVAQRTFIVGLSAAVVVAFVLMLMWLNTPTYKVLYSNLGAEDASRVVEILKKEKVDYKLSDNGSTIQVPEPRVYDLRLKIAGEGGLVGQGVGFEIFDQLKVGQTDFVQKINYQRALQGELSRTITEFPEVEKARVHLVIPRKSLFIEEQADTSASIVLSLAKGRDLDNKQLMAIVNLVAMSVENLSKDRITVADTRGKVLYAPEEEGTLEGLTTSQLEYKKQIETGIERRIEEMLYPVIGAGKVIAKVNADLDFSQETIHKELYDPDSAVVRSEQRSEEATQGQANTNSGVPDANFRGDGMQGALSTQQSSRETRTTNFEINKEEHQIIEPLGELQRLSVAVIVDGTYEKNAETEEYVFVPRKQEEIERLTQLVRSAVGYESSRGDTIEVSSISFGGPDTSLDRSLLDKLLDSLRSSLRPILIFLTIIVFLIVVARPVIMALIRPRVETEMVEGLEGLPEGEERLALMEGDAEEAEAIDALRKIEDIKAHALQMSEQNLDQAVAILRTWMKAPEAAARA